MLIGCKRFFSKRISFEYFRRIGIDRAMTFQENFKLLLSNTPPNRYNLYYPIHNPNPNHYNQLHLYSMGTWGTSPGPHLTEGLE